MTFRLWQQIRDTAAQQQVAPRVWLFYLLVLINIQEVQQLLKNLFNVLGWQRKENQESRFNDDTTGFAQTLKKFHKKEGLPLILLCLQTSFEVLGY